MPHAITVGQGLMAAVYVLLVFVWFAVLIKTDDLLKFRKPPLKSLNYSRIQYAFRVVAFSLALDSLYWAVTNISEILQRGPNTTLRNPVLIAIVKTLVLLSAGVFYYLVDRSSDALNKEFQEAYFFKLVNFTWDAIGILDREGRMKIWNTGAERLFGWRKEEILNKNIKDFLVPKDLHHEIDATLSEIRSTHKAKQHLNTIRQTANSERIPVDISISPIMDPEFKGFFGIMRKSMPLPFHDFRYFTPSDISRHSEGYVFVAMPYSLDNSQPNLWPLAIRGAIEANRLIAVRADYETLTGPVMNQVFNDIRHSTMVVADLTDKNPNVFYEVGLAHMLGKPVIQLIASGEKIPFDLMHIRTIEYDCSDLVSLQDKLRKAITDHIAIQDRKVL